MTKDLHAIRAAWTRFWFAPSSTAPVAVVRVVFGLLVAAWASTLLGPDRLFYGPDGIVPDQPSTAGAFAFLDTFTSAGAARAVVIGILVAALCLAVGFCSRLSGWVVFFGILALHQRNPYVLNGGDLLLRLMAFYVALAPTGAAFSVDRFRRRRRDFWTVPLHAPWALRLLQLQVAVMYFDSVWEKVPGVTWRGGTAVSWSLANDALSRAPGGDWLVDHLVFTNLFTYATLIIELALAVLVWNRRLRPWVLLGGVLLHLGIEIGMPLGYFPAVVLVSYLSFVPAERAERMLVGVRRAGEARSVRLLFVRTTAEHPPKVTPGTSVQPTA